MWWCSFFLFPWGGEGGFLGAVRGLRGGGRGSWGEGFLDELILFHVMNDERASSGGGGGVAPDVADRFAQQGGKAKGEVGPSPHIFRFLLAPDDFGIGGVSGKDGG